jgi:hypothetical protein
MIFLEKPLSLGLLLIALGLTLGPYLWRAVAVRR